MTVQELYGKIGGNYESAKRVMQLDKLIVKFIVKYLDDASCAQLCAAWDKRDGAGVFEGAHAMKGVCGSLGLDALGAQASAICEEFRPGGARTMDDGELARRVDALRADYERVIEGVRAFAAEQ